MIKYSCLYCNQKDSAYGKLYPKVDTISSNKKRLFEADFSGGDITSDGGVLIVRQVDQRLQLSQAVAIRSAINRDQPLASCSTLCRFEHQFDRAAAWKLHEVLVEQFIASFKPRPNNWSWILMPPMIGFMLNRKTGFFMAITTTTQSKTGKKQIFEWTKGLKNAVALAKSHNRKAVSCAWLISNERGQQYTSNGFKSNWQRLMNKAMKEGLINERWRFHDLRSKAASEHEKGDRLLGHQDPKTTRKFYERKPTPVKPIR